MDKAQLQKEVDEYNEMTKNIQTLQQQAQTLQQQITQADQERILKLGRVQMLQELLSQEMAKPDAPVEEKVPDEATA